MDRLARMALLADFYGPLLTEKQRAVWDLHYEQDLSLGEIAEVEGTSRQAVHDLLKRTEKILMSYEEKLGLIGRFLSERESLAGALEVLQSFSPQDFRSKDGWEKLQAAAATLEHCLAVADA